MIQKHLGFALIVVSLGLFIPGIVMTMFSLNMEMGIAIPGANITSEIVRKNLSILTTVKELWQQERYLVSVLIFAFSVLVPIIKSLIVAVVYFAKNQRLQSKLINFVSIIGKWSMADVFVVAIFLAVMSTNHATSAQQEEISFFGMRLGFEVSSQTLSMVGQGFYYFVGYCLLSILATQLVCNAVNQQNTSTGQITSK